MAVTSAPTLARFSISPVDIFTPKRVSTRHDHADVVERIPALDIVCRGLRRQSNQVIGEQLAKQLCQLFVNLCGLHFLAQTSSGWSTVEPQRCHYFLS